MQNVKNREKDRKSNNLIPFIPEGDFYFTKGVEAFRKRKFEVALKWMNKAVEAVPKDPLYQCQMSIIYTEIGSYHKANQVLTNVLQSTGDKYADCYYLLANNYAHLGLLNDARKYAKSYLDLEPEGDFSEEAKGLLQLIEFDDEEDDENDWGPPIDDEDELLIYQETAFYHLEHQEWEKAILILEEMLTLFPEHKTANHEYAHALFFNNERKKAIQMELELLQEEPNNLFSHTNLALFYYEANDEEYKRHIRALLNVYPIHEQQKLRIAVTLARTGYYEESYARFRMLSKGIVKSHVSYYRWYSLTAYRIEEVEKANALWQEGRRKHNVLVQEKEPWNT
ncbi:tetratricopeptide repeat protein [Ornithinibacillus salinisoli]|uniref:Tetratricopeptide repeat protein n=1 Tax=Ornithinibacillus salinisoli TaxID=1848459 RepID=A0ABW4W1X8_9BACI